MARMTVQQVDAFKAREKPFKKNVDTGLQIRVATNGSKSWIVQYMVDGRQREYRLLLPWGATSDAGHLSLADARVEAMTIRALARKGIDYQVQLEELRRAEEQRRVDAVAADDLRRTQEQLDSLSVADLFTVWLADGVRRKDGNVELRRAFAKDVLPVIGTIQVRFLTEHDLRRLLRALVERGVNRLAVVTYNNLRQMFLWAEKRQPWRKLLVHGNPVELIEIAKVVAANYDLRNERKRRLSADEIRELYCLCQMMRGQYENADNKRRAVHPMVPTTEVALWIMLSTLCRVGELSKARWEHVNFETAEWFIPKENSKGATGKKADFLVFLSPFASEQFRALHSLTGHSEWCFPATNREGHLCEKTISKQVGDRQVMFKTDRHGQPGAPMQHRSKNENALALSGGVNGAWTPHDLRRTGATLMQELGVPLDTIDRCQNHVLPGSKTRRHYLLHDYALEKRDAWNSLGVRLELIVAEKAKTDPSR